MLQVKISSKLNRKSLAVMRPDFLTDWDYKKNKLDPAKVSYRSGSKVFWKCPNGHEYKREIRSRTQNGLGCNICNSFGFTHPELAKTWANTNQKTAFDYSCGSGFRAEWICENNHVWEAPIYSRIKHGCATCAGQRASSANNFAQRRPDLMKFWDDKKNTVIPEDIMEGSNKKAHFICEHGHSFSIQMYNLKHGKWCPHCAGKKVGYGHSLADKNPKLAKDWDYEKNAGIPNDFTPNSNKRVFWRCEHGHSWDATIISRHSKNAGCPLCSGRQPIPGHTLMDIFPEIAAEIDQSNEQIDPYKISPFSGLQLPWTCSRGHKYKAKVRSRTGAGTGCRLCSPQSSRPELRIYSEIRAIFGDTKLRHKVNGYEVDIFIPSLNVGIEYDGSYYHNKPKKFISDARKKAELLSAGVHLIRVREKPLICEENDISIATGHQNVTEKIIKDILSHIASYFTTEDLTKSHAESYSSFQAEAEYRDNLACLPGPLVENSLAALSPNIAKEWDLEANVLTPSDVTPGSGLEVHWRCLKDARHRWSASVDSRKKGGCPFCSSRRILPEFSLAATHPGLSGELHPFKNKIKHGALKLREKSRIEVIWQCEASHEFKLSVHERTRLKNPKNCPTCDLSK